MADARPNGITSGLDQVTGILDAIGRGAESLGGIVDTGADIAEDVARGRNAIHEEQRRQEAADLDLWLRRSEFQRGDNKLKIGAWALGAVALVAILVFKD